jgi:hypothetical protein
LDFFNHIGHGKSLAAARHAQKRLVAEFFFQAGDQFVNGLGLVACGFECRVEFEWHNILLYQTGQSFV